MDGWMGGWGGEWAVEMRAHHCHNGALSGVLPLLLAGSRRCSVSELLQARQLASRGGARNHPLSRDAQLSRYRVRHPTAGVNTNK
jgi:hypothetical protein